VSRPGRIARFVLLALLGGCAPPPVFPLPNGWSEGAVVVAVRVDREQAVRSAVVLTPGIRAAGLPAERGDRVVTFVMEAGELVDAAGAAIDPAVLASLDVAIGSAERGCGRCLSPASVAPQIVHAGDACSPPSFARTASFEVGTDELVPVEIDPELIERTRRSVFLTWPGECACTAPMISPATEPALELKTDREGLPVESIARSPEGGVVMLGEHLLERVDSQGRRTERNPIPFAGRILAAVGLPGDRFWVASHAPGALRDTRFDLFDGALDTLLSLSDAIVHRPKHVHYFADRDLVVMAGRGNVQRASLMTCRIADAAADCRELAPDGLEETELTDADRTSEGVLGAIGARGTFIAWERALGPDDPEVRARVFPPIVDGAQYASALAALGQRMFACASVPGGAVIVTATITPDLVTDAARAPMWRVSQSSGALCTDLVATSSGTMRAEFEGGRTVELDRFGDPIGADDGPDVGGPVRARHLFADQSEAIVREDDAVFLRETSGVVRRLRGNDPPRLGFAGAIVAVGSTFYVLPALGEPFGELDGVRFPPAGAIGADEVPTAAVLDEDRSAILVVGTCKTTCKSWARLIELSDRVQPIALPPEVGDQRLLDIAVASPGVAVAIGERDVLVIREGLATTATIAWSGAAPGACEPRSAVAIEDGPLKAVTAAQGVAWVGACDGTLLRVNPFADPPRAEAVRPLDPDPILFDPTLHKIPPITALRAICADDLVLAARASGSDAEEEAAWIWELRGGTQLEPYRGNDSAALARRPSGTPLFFVGPPDRLAMLSVDRNNRFGSFHRFSTRSRLFFAAPFTAAAEDDAGEVLAGTTAARILSFR
jgi:hypothetical protein